MELLMVFVPSLLWLIFLSSWGLFSKLQREKKKRKKWEGAFPHHLSYCI